MGSSTQPTVVESTPTHALSHATGSKVDMHCHSRASATSRLGVQRALGLPECATAPEEVYALAKSRGMDFVTITDHDTITGVLSIADRPDVFVSEELTAHFRGEPQAVHLLCYGITPEDHEWLQANKGDVELCARYLDENDIACALAHPWYAVGAPLTARHRRRLAQLFGVWETRNGARARELNRPADIYVATLDRAGIGGSDDHAGIDIGRTFTETPAAATPQEFLAHVRAGRVVARGAQGSAAKWAHSAITLAARSLPDADRTAYEAPHPRRVMTLVQRLLREADARHGSNSEGLSPGDARNLLRAWLSAVGLDHLDELGLVEYMQAPAFSHGDLYRRACRAHERKLRAALGELTLALQDEAHLSAAAQRLFESCMAAIVYAPATAFLANERAKVDGRREDGELPRVAILADGIGSTHGVSRVIEEIRSRGVPGFEIEVVGTDPDVDRRLAAVAELEVPLYPGLRVGVPSLTAAVQTLSDGAFDAIHVCSPGPVGVVGALLARALGRPLIGSYHTDFTAYAQLRSGRRQAARMIEMGLAAFYGACDVVLSPSPATDRTLSGHGLAEDRVLRWDRGVELTRFDPALRDRSLLAGERINLLYVGRITLEKGADLLAETFLRARSRDERLHLVLAGGGPEAERLRQRLGAQAEHATFLGWLHGEELARVYASADIFLFPSATDTFGQVILEAQASGLPVVAVAAGGPLTLIENGVSGLLRDADPAALASAVLELAGSPLLRTRLANTARVAVRERTWQAALERLARGYRRALTRHGAEAWNAGEAAPRDPSWRVA